MLSARKYEPRRIPKKGEEERCRSYQSRATVCESLGKWGARSIWRDWSEVFGMSDWGSGTVRCPVWCKMSQTSTQWGGWCLCALTGDKVEQERLAAQQAFQNNHFLWFVVNSNYSERRALINYESVSKYVHVLQFMDAAQDISLFSEKLENGNFFLKKKKIKQRCVDSVRN